MPLAGGFIELPLRSAKKIIFRTVCASKRERYFLLKGRALHLAAKWGLYERTSLSLLKKFVSPGDTVVDIGANVGVYSLALASLVGAKGKCVAFEPLPWIYQILNRYVAKFPNVVTVMEGLSDHNSDSEFIKVPLIASGLPEPALATLEESDQNFESVAIKVSTLNSHAKILKKVSFIKVDIEGHELKCLAGADQIIQDSRPIIQIEENKIENIQSYFELCKKCDYSLYHPQNSHSVVPLNQSEIPNNRNLYLIPNERRFS